MCAPTVGVCAGVCFLSKGLGGRLTVKVMPSLGSFEGNRVKFHSDTPALSSSERISPISLRAYADGLNELHKALKSIWHLRSKVSIPFCMSDDLGIAHA